VLYTVHHIVVQTTLFLVAGLVERREGTASLRRSAGLQHIAPVLAVPVPAARAVAGRIPPLSGFVAKLGLLQAGLATAARWRSPPSAAAVLTSLLTLYAMGRVWSEVFWGDVADVVPDADLADAVEVGTARTPALMTAAAAVAVVGGLSLTVIAGPLYGLSERAAEDLMRPERYVTAVLQP
jgi:multicomponent Na+:H+ antiporter subunit D